MMAFGIFAVESSLLRGEEQSKLGPKILAKRPRFLQRAARDLMTERMAEKGHIT